MSVTVHNVRGASVSVLEDDQTITVPRERVSVVTVGVAGPASLAAGDVVTAAGDLIVGTTTGATTIPLAQQPGVNVMAPPFSAAGNGITDDRAAFVAAAAASPTILVPYTASGYLFGSAWSIPANTRIVGIGPRKSRLLHGFNGNFLTMGDGVIFENIWIAGQGATYTGKGLLFTGTDGRQKLLHCQVTDFADYCLDFETGAGSQSLFLDLETWQTDGTTAGKVAVNISATQQLSAKPRKFIGIESGGKKFINLGGSNNTFIAESFIAGVYYHAESRGVQITASRIANETTMDLRGHGNTITGCDIAPRITIASGSTHIAIQGNSHNLTNAVTDSSGNPHLNLIDFKTTTYTATLTSANGNASLGNGTLNAWWSRAGTVVTMTVNLTVGSTTTFGTGAVRISVPQTSSVSVQTGAAIATDSDTTNTYLMGAVLSATIDYVTFRAHAGTTVSATVPFTWAVGDTLRMTMSYLL
jgi:hypothetical protein